MKLPRKRPSECHATQGQQGQQIPDKLESNPVAKVARGNRFHELKETLSLMQEFMVEKGIINNSMSEQEMKEFLSRSDENNNQDGHIEGGKETEAINTHLVQHRRVDCRNAKEKKKGNNSSIESTANPNNCASEVTVYSRAVKRTSQRRANR